MAITKGPFLDQAGLDALVSNINGGFLPVDMSKITFLRLRFADLDITTAMRRFRIDTVSYSEYNNNAFSVDIGDTSVKVVKPGLLYATGCAFVTNLGTYDYYVQYGLVTNGFSKISSQVCLAHPREEFAFNGVLFGLVTREDVTNNCIIYMTLANWNSNRGYVYAAKNHTTKLDLFHIATE